MMGSGNIGGGLQAAAGSKGVMGGLAGLAGALGGGGKQAPAPMPIPQLDTNQGAIAQAAPQMMAQLLQKRKQDEQPFGLSLGGYFG
jgi:hypothetical protein